MGVLPSRPKRRKLVLPGDVVVTGHYLPGHGSYKLDRKVYAKRIGLVEVTDVGGQKVVNVVPFKGAYLPKEGDVVIGKVLDIGIGHWLVDINSPYTAVLPVSEIFPRPVDISKVDLTEHLNIGDLVVARVIAFDLTRDPLLTLKESRLGKVVKGSLLELPLSQIRRLWMMKERITKLVEERYKCSLVIGENGRILVIGPETRQEVDAIKILKAVGEGRYSKRELRRLLGEAR